jgi:hypothetical protein
VPALAIAWSLAVKMKAEKLAAERMAAERVKAERTMAGWARAKREAADGLEVGVVIDRGCRLGGDRLGGDRGDSMDGDDKNGGGVDGDGLSYEGGVRRRLISSLPSPNSSASHRLFLVLWQVAR